MLKCKDVKIDSCADTKIAHRLWIWFTILPYLHTLKNRALAEYKSTVSGRVLGLRLTTPPLTVDSKSSEMPIFRAFYGCPSFLVNNIDFYRKKWTTFKRYKMLKCRIFNEKWLQLLPGGARQNVGKIELSELHTTKWFRWMFHKCDFLYIYLA